MAGLLEAEQSRTEQENREPLKGGLKKLKREVKRRRRRLNANYFG